MDTRIIFEKNRPVFIAGFLYTVTALIVVISAWVIDLRKFDLDITISRYVALRQWTAVMYLIVAAVMVTLVAVHLIKAEMKIIKKILYFLAFGCIFGCAVFPFNREWSSFTSDVHNYFAYGLMLAATVSFVLTTIKPISRGQRVCGIVGIGYAAFFILFYVILDSEYFGDTIFLWENTFIYIFLAELITEHKESKALSIFAKRFPIAGVAGIGLSWLIYIAAPRNRHSIDDYNPAYWNAVNIASILCMICFIIFSLSFITYMLYRPLSEKRKVLDIILRIVITPMVLAIVLAGVYISMYVFYGAD